MAPCRIGGIAAMIQSWTPHVDRAWLCETPPSHMMPNFLNPIISYQDPTQNCLCPFRIVLDCFQSLMTGYEIEVWALACVLELRVSWRDNKAEGKP
jgi:hypothetical protein